MSVNGGENRKAEKVFKDKIKLYRIVFSQGGFYADDFCFVKVKGIVYLFKAGVFLKIEGRENLVEDIGLYVNRIGLCQVIFRIIWM